MRTSPFWSFSGSGDNRHSVGPEAAHGCNDGVPGFVVCVSDAVPPLSSPHRARLTSSEGWNLSGFMSWPVIVLLEGGICASHGS
jgi:hypothetical protein